MAGESVDLLKSVLESESSLAAEIGNSYEEWSTLKNKHRERTKEVREFVFATSTDDTSNVTNGHNHKTNRPKLTQIYDNLKANYMSGLMPNSRWFKFEGEDEDSVDKEKADKISAYLRTKHRLSKFKDTVGEVVDDWVLEGDCFAQVTFVDENHTLPSGEVIKGFRGPKTYRISPEDIVFNPVARDFASTPKIIRSLKSMGEIARDLEEKPELRYERDVFEKLALVRQCHGKITESDFKKNFSYEMGGFGTYDSYLKGGYVEFLDFYGDIYDLSTNTFYKNHCITVVDRRWIIRNEAVDTWKGRPMIFKSGWRKRPDNLWSQGPLENLLGLQYKINHLENAKADAFDQMLIPDRVVIGDVDEEVDEKGAKTYYINSERGDVKNLVPDATVLNADFQIRETEEQMEQYVGAPREGIGVRTPGEKTKFEVATLENARGRLFQFKMNLFETFLEDILNAELEVSRKYFGDKPDQARIEDDETGAVNFEDVTKADVVANGKLVPIGARHYARQAQLAQNLVQFHNILAIDQGLQMHFPSIRLAKAWEELLEFEQFGLVSEYGRIPEQAQAQRLLAAAQKQLAVEAATPDEEDDTPPEEEL